MRKLARILVAAIGMSGLVACSGATADKGNADDGEPEIQPGPAFGPGGGACVPLVTQVRGAPCSSNYGGRATSVVAKLPVLPAARLSDTGALATHGGRQQASLAEGKVGGILDVGVLTSSTHGEGAHAESASEVTGLRVSVAGVGISASAVAAEARASCGERASGHTTITGLVVSGRAVEVTGQPNQRIDAGVALLIINEQSATASGLTVNALHVKVAGVADVVVSSVNALVTNCACEPPPQSEPCDDRDTCQGRPDPGAAGGAGTLDGPVIPSGSASASGPRCDTSNPCAPGNVCVPTEPR